MPEAEIIAIGTELLLGEIQDSNSRFIAVKLRESGVDLHRITIVGDNVNRIVQAIRESLTRADIVITCGGLGPTVDDPTREAVALAMDSPLEFSPVSWEQISARFQRMNRKITDNNQKQAYLPKGSIPIENPVGTAPSFILNKNHKIITSLPGVPHEMEYLLVHKILPYFSEQFTQASFIKKSVLHVSGMGESQIDELIGDLEMQANPTVGLAAHSGQIDIRVTAKADSAHLADQMLNKTATIIRNRLGDNIYGVDEISLPDVVQKELKKANLKLILWEYGFNGGLEAFFSKVGFWRVKSHPNDLQPSLEDLKKRISETPLGKSQCLLGVSLIPLESTRHLAIVLNLNHNISSEERIFGDLESPIFSWVANIVMDFLRKNLKKENK